MTLARAITRAASGAIKPAERVPQSSGRANMGGIGSLVGGGSQTGMNAYNAVGAAYGPIRRICESTALVDWALYRQTDQKGKTDRQLVDDATAPARHPATALWTHPNPFFTRRAFLYLQQLWQETTGGCYWLINDAPGQSNPKGTVVADIELWPIRQDRITPIPDAKNYIAGYVYKLGVEVVPLPVSAVVPIGLPDPLDPMQFTGPMDPIGTDLEAESYAAQYNRNVFLNGARPGGIIQFEMPLEQTRFDELRLRWQEQHQGLSNAARVAILEQGKWVDVSQSNTDMEYLNLRKLSREQVMFDLGMPFAMMVTEQVNLANAKIAEQLFYRWALRPRLELIKESFNERVLPWFGDDLTMDYVLPAPQDEAFDVFAATSAWLAGIITLNQALEAQGYPAIGPDGDKRLYEITGTPPPISPVRPPRAPTGLGFGGDAGNRIEALRRQYDGFLATRQGRN